MTIDKIIELLKSTDSSKIIEKLQNLSSNELYELARDCNTRNAEQKAESRRLRELANLGENKLYDVSIESNGKEIYYTQLLAKNESDAFVIIYDNFQDSLRYKISLRAIE